ncbi:MAG TPA: hypothetical protein VI197_22180 [Polyangiaceae bacterium]
MLREGGHERAQVFLDACGIFRVNYPHGSRIELDDVLWIRARHQQAAGVRKIPVLVDARSVRSMSLTARRAAAGPEIARITSRLVVPVDGPISAVIGNFFMRVAKPPYPTRLFTEVDAAEAWLLESHPTSTASAQA